MDRKRNKYSTVMSRVYNNSKSTLESNVFIRRHEVPSSVNFGANTSISNYSSSVFNELPTVLNDYVVEENKTAPKRSFVVKPKRTLKSLKVVKVPNLPARSRIAGVQSARNCATNPVCSFTSDNVHSTTENKLKKHYSNLSLEKLKELKDEINAYRDRDKLRQLHARLNITYGVENKEDIQEKQEVQEQGKQIFKVHGNHFK